jgi:dihydrofolate reductase
MGTIIVTEFVSVDGVCEGPGGGEGYRHVGWTFTFKRAPASDKYKLDEAMGAEALLLGRVTYDGFARAWPTMTGAYADKFNGMPKYVVSSAMTTAPWNNSTILRGVEDVRRVKDNVKGSLVVHGSPTLVQGLLEADLVDELRLMVFPLILGSGKRLFGETADVRRLQLQETQDHGAGVTLMVYRRA